MENIIEVKELAKVFGNQTALESVDFQVKKGEIFGFLGPSGSGKTTTIKILTGQVTPTSGTAMVFGEPVSQLKKSEYRSRFGVLTDNSGLYERLSIHDNLKLYCDLYNVPHSEIDEVLDAVNLRQDRSKRISALSKGMAQRVTLARALIHKPELLFLDEPTSALDPGNSLHIHEGLRALNERGTTIFLTTHDMQEAELLCDRIAFLDQGMIQLLDTPKKLKQRFSDSTITVELATEEKVVLSAGNEGANRLFDYMNNNQVVTVHSNEPTLGEIFVQVTGRELA
ncbi:MULTISPECIES: ABC transporter ATP-binding protein [unclassified Sporosarcina]|uniref:ABC transporter ATP-binding protein n=1 Tax=unclassified Sporosarcina TaxID=2647733 RepID=UPI00203C96D7|nr:MULTISPECIES: ABC transporter ATP-binding protein [unclassified Sporosarcina]GKV64059.1 bacitracin ABC transporter ATP-binding protein [Sporosarcina sp. NCCP-2331]GLB56366.1 bacitracin ABC transporter ATP-binding protein [Sporosarcina sp. NCCP-2378]